MQNVRDILSAHIGELDEETAKAIEADVLENYRTIAEVEAKAKAIEKGKARIAELEQAIAERDEKIAQIDGDGEELAKLKEQVAEFQQRETERAEAQAKAEREAKFREAFDAAVGDRKFANDIVRDAVFQRSMAAREADPVKGYAEIIAELTKDKNGIWENAQTDPKNLPRPGEDGGEGGVEKPTFKHFF